MHQEVFHFTCHLLFLRLAFLPSLDGNESSIEFNDVHGGDSAGNTRVGFSISDFVVVAELLVFAVLHRSSAAAVSNVGHQDQCEEEPEGQVGFPLLNFRIKEDDVEPDVGND